MASSVQPTVVNESINKPVTIIKCEVDDDCQQFNEGFGAMPGTMALGNYGTKSGGFGNNAEVLDCVVCGDRATGKHYGAISCDGCKGFFRRSVRKNPVYECRHQNNCTIDKDKRNQCRHCRWKKCIRMGMKKEAVQKERDRLGRQRSSNYHYGMAPIKTSPRIIDDPDGCGDDDDDLSVMCLLRAEKTAQEYIGRQFRLDRQPPTKERVQATLETICISMNYQLRSLIEWAKDLKSFVDLSDNDKIALLRGHTGENLVLGVACRSLNCDDYLLLGNHYIIPRNTSDPGLARPAARILDEIVKPLKEIQLDEKEYACLKAIVFFDNDNNSLSDPMRVKNIRKRIQVNLETYINQHRPLMRGRFGELLLLLPPLQNIARLMVDLVARYNHDTKQVDDLINEMLLISKENDLDSNASSIDTDMEDNLSQDAHQQQYDPLSSATPVANSVLMVPPSIDDELQNVSLNDRDDYLSDNISHLHMLHSTVNTDPTLNATPLASDLHEHRNDGMLHFYSNSSHDRLKTSQSQPITTPSPPNIPSATSYDPTSDMSFLCDLMTPPTSTPIQQSIPSPSNPSTRNLYYNDPWAT